MQHATPASSKTLSQYRIVGINLAVILFVLSAAAIVPRNGQALVIVAPWSDPGRVIDVIGRAGGSVMNGTGAPYAAIAYSDDPGFTLRLFKSGAMLVLDGSLAFFCRSTSSL
ncbi:MULTISPECIES: hypothetical protein [Hoeflea]|jgi:hypothetical protein|uniref:Uncharacterized protein n=1 Tax=Hoeflea alexandrii TaxID=288436 RepID=A0ABT1CPC1_9HYPH|nr:MULTISPECIES: hypothetical protein [Hoeflea]MBV6650839.1 hypothetical protein [Hoeflea sp.]MCO6408040.1 hypothetical protein [Hoeflea alexandrii]VVT12164.1 conserved hypothetical protein [Hoeflea sp. EC-HK425]|tara:strand:+ start:509 stop:844 length:336 start_codon:yes stop_codon:yes gene_type:complete